MIVYPIYDSYRINKTTRLITSKMVEGIKDKQFIE